MLWMIDNYDSFVHNLATYFVELACEIKIIRNDKLNLDELSRVVDQNSRYNNQQLLDGLIISPGPKSPSDSGLCKEALQIAAGKIPVLGVCLGHQIIAQTYGAKVIHGLKPMHGKISSITHSGENLFYGLPKNFDVTRYHSLVVSEKCLPQCLQIDALANDGMQNTIMAISHRSLPIYGLQFHPEAVLSEYGHQILQNFVDICKAWHNQRELTLCKQAV